MCLRVIHVLSLSLFLLSLPVLRARFVVPSEPSLRTRWRSSWLFSIDSRQYIVSTTEELLARFVNLENEAFAGKTTTRFSGTGVGSGPTTYSAFILRRQCAYAVNWSHRHAPSQQAEDVHWSASGMDNLAIHVQGVRVCDARKNERRGVSYTERLGSCDQH